LTIFYLIRHAAHGLLGQRMAGRMAGVRLSPEGRAQAQQLATRLGSRPIQAVYAGPLERARETAEPLAVTLGIQVEIADEVNELDFGEWTGQALDELRELPAWQLFNSFRSGTRIPGGELMPEVQTRILSFLESAARRHVEAHVAIISHGDVIKSALAYYLGIPLDLFQRIEVSPASVSIIELQPWGPRLLALNWTENPPVPA
jgi:probable phosphomutase (TIGR03848 family)